MPLQLAGTRPLHHSPRCTAQTHRTPRSWPRRCTLWRCGSRCMAGRGERWVHLPTIGGAATGRQRHVQCGQKRPGRTGRGPRCGWPGQNKNQCIPPPAHYIAHLRSVSSEGGCRLRTSWACRASARRVARRCRDGSGSQTRQGASQAPPARLLAPRDTPDTRGGLAALPGSGRGTTTAAWPAERVATPLHSPATVQAAIVTHGCAAARRAAARSRAVRGGAASVPKGAQATGGADPATGRPGAAADPLPICSCKFMATWQPATSIPSLTSSAAHRVAEQLITMLAGFVHLVGELLRSQAAPTLRHRGSALLDLIQGSHPCVLKALGSRAGHPLLSAAAAAHPASAACTCTSAVQPPR